VHGGIFGSVSSVSGGADDPNSTLSPGSPNCREFDSPPLAAIRDDSRHRGTGAHAGLGWATCRFGERTGV